MKRATPIPRYACQRCGGWFTPPPARRFRVVQRQEGHARYATLVIWCDDCESRESPDD